MEINFNGKRALVTGAANGIGKAVATKLLEYGAQVVAIDIQEAGLELIKNELPGIEAHEIDISKWEETKTLISQIGPLIFW
ncbi:L-xylulose reductase-like protein [Leptotrombidium deliense]|uniref:L-xylulose reductase-like protein n=1 Tax=Leptotrombidium deliense TaxID=299467 RepID=A0A443RU36_9ACAR|nr:L-xylulose reductase-like protein [Leptotrombidium deliense]